jgi:hypothetical protein
MGQVVAVSRPRIAVVGSVDESRTFDPPIIGPGQARKACEELGFALAEADWNLVVYSSKPSFIEADVVRGYRLSEKAPPKSIEVRVPIGKATFEDDDIFDPRPDSSKDWEVSFYRSLVGCDGVLLIGGRYATLVTGLIALALRIPIIAVATFGGATRTVWERLDNDNNDATKQDVALMAGSWRDGSARQLVHSLVAQRDTREQARRDAERRQKQESRRALSALAVATVLLLLAVAALTLVWGWRPGTGASIAILALVPALAGGAGALVRTSLDAERDWARAGILGAAAGLVTGLLYVASQLLGAPDVLEASNAEGVRRLLFFVLPIGFVAGLTFDAVYTKLKGTDVSQADTLGKA